jgi:putative transposase
MTGAERVSLIRAVEAKPRQRRRRLKRLGIPESTYYHWRRLYEEGGPGALDIIAAPPRPGWNRLMAEEEAVVLSQAKDHPELSSRLLAVKITDEEEFSVSESTVYRLLKTRGLIAPRPLPQFPAAKEYRHKTTRPNEMWQIDATNFFVVGWGYYKLIPVLDDYSRKIVAWELMPDESADSISMAVESAVEAAGVKTMDPKPVLLSDNGSGFTADILAKYLRGHGIRHIFGKPYHPQTQGKVERFNRRIKEGVCLLVYCSPDELRQALTESISRYNVTPHEGLKNVSPNDVYEGRQEEILKRREEKKRWTLARRKILNLEPAAKRQN